MRNKISMAINWAGACGGCDVSILDIEEKILEVARMSDIVYWPAAMDFKRKDIRSYQENSIDICLFNGMVRNSEQMADAQMLRKRCKVLIAYGSCACFGGIPGLANGSKREEILTGSYRTNPTTNNPDRIVPDTVTKTRTGDLTLPEVFRSVKTLNQVVPVDYYLPGCPPTIDQILRAVEIISLYTEKGELPPKGAVVASDKALCSECGRAGSKNGGRMARITRPHEIVIDADLCMLEQGILCMGPFTRGGCGGQCINANMPCRGCFGPLDPQLDPGAEALSSFGAVIGPENEDYVTRPEMMRSVSGIQDPLGTFYRFTLPSAIINQKC